MTDDVTWLDYDDLARVLGIERESARRLVIRKRWRRSKGNDGKARVGVPNDALPAVVPSPTGERPVYATADVTGEEKAQGEAGTEDAADIAVTGEILPEPVTEPVTTVLVRHVERLEAEIAELRTRAADRDTIAMQVEALRAVLEEVRGDRDRWHAAATAKPDPELTRPWWKRLAG